MLINKSQSFNLLKIPIYYKSIDYTWIYTIKNIRQADID